MTGIISARHCLLQVPQLIERVPAEGSLGTSTQTEIGQARINTSSENAHTDARRRRRRFNVGGVRVVNDPPCPVRRFLGLNRNLRPLLLGVPAQVELESKV